MILRFIVAAIVFYLLYRISRFLFLPASKKVKPLARETEKSAQGEDLVEDPYCHVYIPISEAHKLDMNGETLYFCSKACLEQFQNQRNVKREEA